MFNRARERDVNFVHGKGLVAARYGGLFFGSFFVGM
jgi:hypothetical protein